MCDPRLQTVLLIDDNPNDRLLVKRELRREFEDVNIHEIIDQKQFDQALIAGDFDFVITDFQLGWTNGLKTLRAVRETFSDCPVIMFTNTGTQEIAVEAMKSGLDDYVIKSPRHFVRLCQAVRSVWQKHQTKVKAAELEQRLQALLNQLDVGIFRANQQGQLIDANAATLSMLGAQSLEAAQHALAGQFSASNRLTDVPYTHEVELCNERTQQSLWLKIIATPTEVNGAIITEGLIEDITAQKQAEQALNQLNQTLEDKIQQRTEELEQVNNELELFAYSVSHDLRTPIRQIDGFINLLAEALEQPSRDSELNKQSVERYLSVLSAVVEQANTMIDALLTYSRTGSAEMIYHPVDMNQLVQQLVSQVADSAPERQIKWDIAALPVINCDRALISTVWQNLIDNAVKFTQSCTEAHIQIGSKPGSAQPAAQALIQTSQPSQSPIDSQPNEEVIFFIKDNGIGFNSKQADRIFGIFQQAHSRETASGVGIGLASVKRIIARHGGRVWAEGGDSLEVNRHQHLGATVCFSLPKTLSNCKKT